jgi:hypothetical protein
MVRGEKPTERSEDMAKLENLQHFDGHLRSTINSLDEITKLQKTPGGTVSERHEEQLKRLIDAVKELTRAVAEVVHGNR